MRKLDKETDLAIDRIMHMVLEHGQNLRDPDAHAAFLVMLYDQIHAEFDQLLQMACWKREKFLPSCN